MISDSEMTPPDVPGPLHSCRPHSSGARMADPAKSSTKVTEQRGPGPWEQLR